MISCSIILTTTSNAKIKRGGVDAISYNIMYPDTLSLAIRTSMHICYLVVCCPSALSVYFCPIICFSESFLLSSHHLKHTDMLSDVPPDPYLHTIMHSVARFSIQPNL